MSRRPDRLPEGPPDPRRGRQRYLVAYLRATVAVVLVLAVAAIALPDDSGARVAGAMLVLLALAPLVRVAWLLGRWISIGDRRFAAVAASLLVVVAAAVAIGQL